MENVSSASNSFLLLGLVEMEEYRYLYGALSLVIYIMILFLSSMIVLVVLTDQSLHEPMYILICNLSLNGIFGSTSVFPKVIIDLFSSFNMVSRTGCFIQILCVMTFSFFEISTFTIMAYDRYLAVYHPLQYITIMTNKRVLEFIGGSLIYCCFSNLSSVILSATLPLCGTHIKNIFCENMSIVNLSCANKSMAITYGNTITVIFLIITLSSIAYSYLRIFVICFKISKDACQKAIHTLVTHILCFSIFLIGALFLFARYRLDSANIPFFGHILLSITPLIISPLFNPLIYGIRTKALRMRVIQRLQKIMWTCT
ncbi:olfactory receptor 52E2-like [Discoglossus pictus]